MSVGVQCEEVKVGGGGGRRCGHVRLRWISRVHDTMFPRERHEELRQRLRLQSTAAHEAKNTHGSVKGSVPPPACLADRSYPVATCRGQNGCPCVLTLFRNSKTFLSVEGEVMRGEWHGSGNVLKSKNVPRGHRAVKVVVERVTGVWLQTISAPNHRHAPHATTIVCPSDHQPTAFTTDT